MVYSSVYFGAHVIYLLLLSIAGYGFLPMLLERMFSVRVALPGQLLIISSTNVCFCFSYSLVNISRTACKGFRVASTNSLPNYKTL